MAAAAVAMMVSISARSAALSVMSAAARLSSTWRAWRAPTMATCTAGLANVQAIASWLTVMPRSAANFSSAATAARLRR